MRKILLGLGILPCLVFAQSDDNEIWIEQSRIKPFAYQHKPERNRKEKVHQP